MVNTAVIDWLIEGMDDMYCEGFIDGWNAQAEIKPYESRLAFILPYSDGNYYCSACGCIVDPVFDFCCHCGAELDLEFVL